MMDGCRSQGSSREANILHPTGEVSLDSLGPTHPPDIQTPKPHKPGGRGSTGDPRVPTQSQARLVAPHTLSGVCLTHPSLAVLGSALGRGVQPPVPHTWLDTPEPHT